MYTVIFVLDYFFLKYEGGLKLTPRKILSSRIPALLGLKLASEIPNSSKPFKSFIKQVDVTMATHTVYL